ncbi:MAG: tyrosine-type recombinase/integrase [Deltaproteobacteria bacterium]|nr:tyrosine-type recombinase/integrase [Deltaproteobacteria bacterium]
MTKRISLTESNGTLVGPLLQAFFLDHLTRQKRVSPQTIHSYRDSFRLFLHFLQHTTGKEPAALVMTDLDAPAVLQFLEHIEAERHNQVQSRNVRLAAIRSFARMVALHDPASVGIATRVLAIPVKRSDKRLVGYLTRLEMDALLAVHDLRQWTGRRNHALLLTLYNTGARVSEMTTLQRTHVTFGLKSFVQFTGKGRKERAVPLWPTTSRTLQAWFKELAADPRHGPMAFPNARGKPLTRDGVHYLLEECVTRAIPTCPSLATKRISPHVIRHTVAMHLLQAGVDLSVIALWLGHESMQTTHGYLEADLATKEQVLEKITPAGQPVKRFTADDTLLHFLATL